MEFAVKLGVLSLMALWGIMAMTWGFLQHRSDVNDERAAAAVLTGMAFTLIPLFVLTW